MRARARRTSAIVAGSFIISITFFIIPGSLIAAFMFAKPSSAWLSSPCFIRSMFSSSHSRGSRVAASIPGEPPPCPGAFTFGYAAAAPSSASPSTPICCAAAAAAPATGCPLRSISPRCCAFACSSFTFFRAASMYTGSLSISCAFAITCSEGGGGAEVSGGEHEGG